ncbi:glutathione synthetase-like [Babylonia areolata]|uniref:glutathione synthetase-like n=1 Tax=Babylonia areolata TaxID=304850 RepID=UPI003FD2B11E
MATCLNDHQFTDGQMKKILNKATDWALTNGLVFKPDQRPEAVNQAVCAPFTLFPSVVPRHMLQQAKDCMKDFNTLMYRVAQDHHFLEQSLRSVIPVDPFVRRLWDIYTTVRTEGAAQTISVDLFRNDFMMNVTDSGTKTSAGIPPSSALQLKQIEFNTISASFAGLVGRTGLLHRYTLDLAGKDYTAEEMPDNEPALGMARGLVTAWELYGNPEAIILFLVSGTEANIIDQRWLELKTHQLNRKINIVRATLDDVHTKGSLGEDKKFFLDQSEVAVVYLRAGYGENSYTSEKDWSARLLMERSRSIKCPTVRSQLSGSKKVQQELARPGAVERFIQDPAAVHRIRQTFAGLYSLDKGSEGNEAVKMAIESPDKFVLKPQREGGGHNLYGEEMKSTLEKIGTTQEREAYILMERIFPLPEKNYMVKEGIPPMLAETVSEMGIYGVHIGEGEKEIANTVCGHMLRTKTDGMDEGGIVVGVAVLDTPFVVDV